MLLAALRCGHRSVARSVAVAVAFPGNRSLTVAPALRWPDSKDDRSGRGGGGGGGASGFSLTVLFRVYFRRIRTR